MKRYDEFIKVVTAPHNTTTFIKNWSSDERTAFFSTLKPDDKIFVKCRNCGNVHEVNKICEVCDIATKTR